MTHEVVKSVGRVIEVLELFDDCRQPMTASEICESLSYPNSSADALLKSLVSLGYLSLDTQKRRYFPSLRVTRLGDWIPEHLFTDDMMGLLRDLHSATGETVTLSTQSDLHMQFVRVIPGTFPISLRITEGYLGPLFGSAVGTAFLSQLPDKQIKRLLQRARRTPKAVSSKVTVGDVLREVENARERGYAVAYDRILQDTGAVAMPLPRHRNFVIGVGGLAPRIHRSEASLIKHMSRALGTLRRSSRRNESIARRQPELKSVSRT